MKIEIIPTVFAKKIKEQEERMSKLAKVAKRLQIDIMDGKFVAVTSPHPVSLPNLRKFKKTKFEAHLMVREPEWYIELLKEKGCDKVIFHVEAFNSEKGVKETIAIAKKQKMKVFLAINPNTPVESLFPFLKNINGVMFMGVYPGAEGQELINETYYRISKLRAKDRRIVIQIDGGVNAENSSKLVQVGVTLFGVGSSVSKADNPKEVIKVLEKAARKKSKV